MNKEIYKNINIYCDCMNIDHLIRFSYEDDPEDNNPMDFLYAYTSLNPELSFFQRLWQGIRYVFRIGEHNYCMFGESLLKPEDAENLIKFLNEYSSYIKRIKNV